MRIQELRTQLGAALARWYRPREILVRSDGRVRYLVLSTNRQIAATAAVGAVALGLGATALGWTIAEYRLQLRTQDVETARTAYVELLAEVSQYYDEFSALARDLEANEQALLAIIGGQNGSVDVHAIEEQLARSRETRAEGLAGSASLKGKLDLFASDLRAVVSRNEQLAQNIALLQAQLSAAEEEKRAGLEQQDELRAQLDEAERALAEADARNAGLDAALADLEERLAEAEEARVAALADGSELRVQIASLEEDLSVAADRNLRTERRLGETQRQLEALRGQRRQLVLARDRLSSEVGWLQSRIAAIESSHQSVVLRLAERTRVGADEVEKTVAMTGIEVDSLLRKVSTQLMGLGGPFVPAGTRPSARRERAILASVAPLDLEMSRWEQLHAVMRSLPLNAPLDGYAIGSSFGMRKDPLNAKLAVHEGLDFTAPMGSAVLATAPGKVVFAGRKGSYGRMVEIDHGFGIHTRYAHLKEITVETGQTVGYRERIGKLGSSGRSTGPHLHYEILVDGKPYDPMNFLKAGRYVFKG
ncbi:MAG: hypothetical protein BroJett029_09350 [Alphaproteobacteria bacterium]|nr:MAG: hypothetical protein BroJett029_09350 [Alphaproteobacteria bacterium]